MAISRRAFGVGLIAASAAGTGGYVYLRQHRGAGGEPAQRRRHRAGFARAHRWRCGDVVSTHGLQAAVIGKLFDDYVAGGAGAQPLIVGYENQLIEWVLQDADRWKRVEAVRPRSR
jgi:hypothetical protein